MGQRSEAIGKGGALLASEEKCLRSREVAPLLRRVAARCLSYLAGLRELAQAG